MAVRVVVSVLFALCAVASGYVITSPANGTLWLIGHTYNISWTPADLQTLEITLCLNNQNPPSQAGYQDGSLVLSARVPSSTGFFSWKLAYNTYTNYFMAIRVANTAGPINFGGPFTIAPANITVTNPVSGGLYGPGSSMLVTWNDFPTNQAQLMLAANLAGNFLTVVGVLNVTLINNQSNSFTWQVTPETIVFWPYRCAVVVFGISDGLNSGYSRTSGIFNFRGVSLVRPSSGETLVAQTVCPINWTGPSSLTFVDITLAGTGLALNISLQTPSAAGSNAYQWLVPASLNSSYTLSIRDSLFPSVIATRSISIVALISCASSQYETQAPTCTTNRVCASIRTCPNTTEYLAVPPTATSNAVCLNVSACSAAQYKAAAATATSDVVCQPITACPSFQFAATLPTATTDTLCRNTALCTAAQFIAVSGTNISDAVCANVTRCASTPGLYQSVPPTATSNALCANISTCPTNQFISTAASATSDVLCTPTHPCAAQQFITAQPTATSDFACQAITLCTQAQYAAQLPTATSDTVCRNTTICTAAQYTALSRTNVSDAVCANVTRCTAAQYRAVAPSATSDAQCAAISTCLSSQFISTSATATSDLSCTATHPCTAQQYITAQPTATSDYSCANTTLCSTSPAQYETQSPTATTDRACQTVTTCRAGSYTVSNATATSDRVCQTCQSGFSGDGVSCSDINECGTNNGGCSFLATCKNTIGSRSCLCPAGYSGDGLTCNEILLCDSSPCVHGNCSDIRRPLSYSCTCFSGYRGQTCNESTVAATTQDPSSSSSTGIIIGVVVGGVCLLILLVLLAIFLRRRRNEPRPSKTPLAAAKTKTVSTKSNGSGIYETMYGENTHEEILNPTYQSSADAEAPALPPRNESSIANPMYPPNPLSAAPLAAAAAAAAVAVAQPSNEPSARATAPPKPPRAPPASAPSTTIFAKDNPLFVPPQAIGQPPAAPVDSMENPSYVPMRAAASDPYPPHPASQANPNYEPHPGTDYLSNSHSSVSLELNMLPRRTSIVEGVTEGDSAS